MTRLQTNDISEIASQLNEYDEELLHKTGHNLRQIACYATQLKEKEVLEFISSIRVWVVPIKWGLGKIEGFCESVAAILKHIGFDTFVAENTDVAGLVEAYKSGPI